MKIICTQENLKTGLAQVSRVVGSSQTLPVLNNVLLKTENGQLKISATNLEMGISTVIRCKIEVEGGVCLTAKVLLDLVNNLPNENITIEVGEVETKVSTTRYQTKIKHLPVEEFPIIPVIEDSQSISIPSNTLKSTIDSVVFSASTSETQPELSGVLFKFDSGKLTITATDRYRLSEHILDTNSDFNKSVIIPHRSILELSRLLLNSTEPTQLDISETQIAVSVNDTYLVTRLIDGQYPEYSQIIPTENGTVITLQHKDLLSALKTSGIFSKGVGSINLNFDIEKQILQTKSASQGVGESVIDIPCTITGVSGSVIMNYRYILDLLLNTESEQINMHVIDDTNPVVFRPEDNKNYLYLIMPIRL
jgi:DNA polymerase-3 subunit beta